LRLGAWALWPPWGGPAPGAGLRGGWTRVYADPRNLHPSLPSPIPRAWVHCVCRFVRTLDRPSCRALLSLHWRSGLRKDLVRVCRVWSRTLRTWICGPCPLCPPCPPLFWKRGSDTVLQTSGLATCYVWSSSPWSSLLGLRLVVVDWDFYRLIPSLPRVTFTRQSNTKVSPPPQEWWAQWARWAPAGLHGICCVADSQPLSPWNASVAATPAQGSPALLGNGGVPWAGRVGDGSPSSP
jgi:hypothetical protein